MLESNPGPAPFQCSRSIPDPQGSASLLDRSSPAELSGFRFQKAWPVNLVLSFNKVAGDRLQSIRAAPVRLQGIKCLFDQSGCVALALLDTVHGRPRCL